MIGKEDNKCSMSQIDFLISGQYVSNRNTIANSRVQSDIDPLLYFQPNNKSYLYP